MSQDREQPEGVVNANPVGGWEDGRNADDSPDLPVYGQPGSIEEPPVEGSVEGADPDLIADADLEQGRRADPAVDEAERVRSDGGV